MKVCSSFNFMNFISSEFPESIIQAIIIFEELIKKFWQTKRFFFVL